MLSECKFTREKMEFCIIHPLYDRREYIHKPDYLLADTTSSSYMVQEEDEGKRLQISALIKPDYYNYLLQNL